MKERVLYLFTGIVTAIPVPWALEWAAWGAGVSIIEYLSLFGSLILLTTAEAPKGRLAARRALVGAMCIWSFYLPLIVAVAWNHFDNQELKLSVFRWTPSAVPLMIEQPKRDPKHPDLRLSAEEIQQIRNTGITGVLSAFAINYPFGHGKTSRVVLIMQKPVTKSVILKEPDLTTIVYVQAGDGWRMYPPHAPASKRIIRLQPETGAPNQNSLSVERSDGARPGFDV